MKNLLMIPLIFAALNVINASSNTSEKPNMEMKLMNDLIFKRRIDQYSRPVQHHNHTIVVNVHLILYNILSVDERTEAFSAYGFLRMEWKDFNLTWNASDYEGITQINVPEFLVWKPDVHLINRANMAEVTHFNTARSWINVFLRSDGRIRWSPPSNFHVRCPMDVSAFPFDEHDCHLAFESWSFTQERVELRLHPESVDKNGNVRFLYMDSGMINGWKLIDTYAKTFAFKVKSGTYPRVIYHIRIGRQAPYYQLAIVAPIIMTIFPLLAMFWLPPNAGERIALNGMVSLILTIFLIHLHWIIPQNGTRIPGLVTFCGISTVFSGVSLVFAVMTLALSSTRSKWHLPRFLTNFLAGSCGSFLCLTDYSKQEVNLTARFMPSNNDYVSFAHADPVQKEDDKNMWMALASAVNRILFILLCVSYVVLICVSFSPSKSTQL